MKTEGIATDFPKPSGWAIASLALCIAGCVLGVLVFLSESVLGVVAFYSALYSWGISFASGIIALDKIRRRRPALKGRTVAILGICLSGAAVLIFGCIMIWTLYATLRGEPYDESHPKLVLANVEKDCGFKFPERVESLKAADRIAPGVGPGNPYVFVVRFVTDQNGYDQLRDSLSRLDRYKEKLAGRGKVLGNLFSYRDIPLWYKAEMTNGVLYESTGIGKTIWLSTVCVGLDRSDEVEVYMEGFGDPNLRSGSGRGS